MKPEFIVRVHRPELTEEERARRMKRIYNAAEKVMKEVIRNDVKNSV